ncbi:MAG: TIM barrel protein [Phreatobacter sp.]|uniref:hydroxypyruvate isomerase family protein n=1 Tax=Phreatobacter sp. TaxID=1966341 RepID=UPI001A4B6DE0|nr:TIM barrel protein [Phreatobacter sp.]MBL8571511.1 TIM barrel protein [Phreatobacter sp.]
MPRFSANLGFLWQGLPLLDQIEAAAKAGFRAIEMHWPYDTDPKAVRAACERLGLAMLGVNTVRGDTAKGENGLGALPGRQAEFQAAIDQAIAWQVAAGGTAIHAMAGIVKPADKPEATGVWTENLSLAADKAARHGLTILLEPLNPRASPGYFYSTLRGAGEMIARVGKPNVKIMFDVHHVGIAEGDVLTNLDAWWPMIGHVQIAAVPSRAEPDEGEIDFRAIFARLDAKGYGGWVGAEYRPRGDMEAGLAWVKKLGVSL